jgi:hypothetical protein
MHIDSGRRGLAGFAIIEDGSKWNETFLNLYNDRDLGRES